MNIGGAVKRGAGRSLVEMRMQGGPLGLVKAAIVVAAAVLVLPMPEAVAAPEISRTSRPVLRLLAGDKPQTVLIEGRRLNELTAVTVEGWESEFSIRLGRSLSEGTMRLFYVNASEAVPSGTYPLQLIHGDNGTKQSVLLSLMALEVKGGPAKKTQAKQQEKGPQPVVLADSPKGLADAKPPRSKPSVLPKKPVVPLQIVSPVSVASSVGQSSVNRLGPPQLRLLAPGEQAFYIRGLKTNVMQVPPGAVDAVDVGVVAKAPVVSAGSAPQPAAELRVISPIETLSPESSVRPVTAPLPASDVVNVVRQIQPPRRPLPNYDDLEPEDSVDVVTDDELDDFEFDAREKMADAININLPGGRLLPMYWIQGMAQQPMLVGAVRDAISGEPVVGAQLSLGEQQVRSAAQGLYGLVSTSTERLLRVSAPGYKSVALIAPRQSGNQLSELDITLRAEKETRFVSSKPDLLIVMAPSTPICRGEERPVRARIMNIGDRTASNYRVALNTKHWREGEGAAGTSDKPVSIDGPRLRPGETVVLDLPAFIDFEAMWAEFVVTVDDRNQLAEASETNNTSNPRRIVVASLPDCEMADIAYADLAIRPEVRVHTESGEEGCELVIDATLANFSNRGTSPTEVVVQIQAGKNAAFSATFEVAEMELGDSQPLQFRAPVDQLVQTLAKQLSRPSMLPSQDVVLTLEVDPRKLTDERFTTNNRVQFDGRLDELISADELLYRKQGEACRL